MTVHVHTESQTFEHSEADSAKWNESGVLEVYSGTRIVALYSPGKWITAAIDNQRAEEPVTMDQVGCAIADAFLKASRAAGRSPLVVSRVGVA